MALLPPGPTHLAVRWIHVVAMATLFGGALLCWWTLRRTAADPDAPAVEAAAAYEWLFWAAAGLVVLTGVGNLGALAPTIPGPGTAWGTAFSIKLVGVVALAVGSLVRTVGVAHLLGGSARPAGAIVGRLRVGYAATALWLLLVVAVAEVLAHG